jgi:arylsulfatase A-like enzyme
VAQPICKDSDYAGTIGKTVADSTPSWLPRDEVSPRPNVIVILCDDLGFSDIGCFGSEIETPHLDQLAREGALFSNFHATPLCSPSRAALLTGMNHHESGMGNLAGADHGFPGYRGELADDVLTQADVFRYNGYSTLMVGKWHLTHSEDHSDASSKKNWPLQRGFDRFYGFLSGFTNLHHPDMLYEDNHAVATEQYPEGYYFTDDITDRAIDMIRGVKAAGPEKPFYLYMAHGAAHAPLMAKPDDLAKYRGRYDIGWDEVRRNRFDRQQTLGVIPKGTELPPPNSEPDYQSAEWTSLEDDERRLYARYMEVYAAMIDSVDQNWGRLREALTQLGEFDNTIVLFTADNGASREGGERGTTEYYRTVAAVHQHLGENDDSRKVDISRLDLIGGPQVMAHFPWAWGAAANTPFRLHKGTTFQGGHHVACIASWPNGIKQTGTTRTQYAHLIDVLPTFVDVLNLEVPVLKNGVSAKPMSGTSFAPLLEDSMGADSHAEQYYEMTGHRGYYADGWEAVTLHYPNVEYDEEEWQLYHLVEDPAQAHNLADMHPERVAELVASWDKAAKANQVYPLDDGSGGLRLRDPGLLPPSEPITLFPNSPTLERGVASQFIQYRSWALSASFDYRSHDEGIIVSHGDQGGGYVLYIDTDGSLIYGHNAYGKLELVNAGALGKGRNVVRVEVAASMDGTWDLHLAVDNVERARALLPALTILAPFQGIDIGRSRRSPVNWDLQQRHGAFPYTGELHRVTYEPGDFIYPALQQLLQHHAEEARTQ